MCHFQIKDQNENNLKSSTLMNNYTFQSTETPQQSPPIRRYDSVNWVSTSFKTRAKVWWLDLMALVPAFRRMKNYHNGKNHGIPMCRVAPGMVKIPERKGSWILNFLLPSFHQSNYTEPTNKEVEIVTTPEMYVYVKPYKGWLNEDATQAQLLFKSLGMSSDVTPHWAVAYSSRLWLL
uniref:Heme-binding protein soul5 n=1 Tax=Neogobius melanostomus TaxID=47308 RepID=A0A8C6WI74_9GOBI